MKRNDMQNNRICYIHGEQACLVDLSQQTLSEKSFLCLICVTQQKISSNLVQIDVLDLLIQNLKNQKQSDLEMRLKEQFEMADRIKNNLYQYQNLIEVILKKFFSSIDQIQNTISQKLEEKTSIHNQQSHYEFFQNYYQGNNLLTIQSDDDINLLIEPVNNIKYQLIKLFTSNQYENIVQNITEVKSKLPYEQIVYSQYIRNKDTQEDPQIVNDDYLNFQDQVNKLIQGYTTRREEMIERMVVTQKQEQDWYSENFNQFFQNTIHQKRKPHQIFQQSKDLDLFKQQSQEVILQKLKQQIQLEEDNYCQELINFYISQIKHQSESQYSIYEIVKNIDNNNNNFVQLLQKIKLIDCFQQTGQREKYEQISKDLHRQNLKVFIKISSEIQPQIINEIPKNIQNENLSSEHQSQEITINDYTQVLEKLKFQKNQIEEINSPEKLKQLFEELIMSKHKHQKLGEIYQYENLKQLFQVTFNNSSKQVQQRLLRITCLTQPVQLIYLNSFITEVQSEEDLYCLNEKLFYIFPECYPIISFNFSPNQTSFGKTYLLNQLFYDNQQVFQVNDKCMLNSNTVDIMFDQSRQYAIADLHGKLPINTLMKILPLFKFWILQINTESEYQENKQQLELIGEQIKIPDCCFIIRNYDEQDLHHLNLQFQNCQPEIYFIRDLQQDQKLSEIEIQRIKQPLLQKIQLSFQMAQENLQLVNSNYFYKIIKDYYSKNIEIIKLIESDIQLLQIFANKSKQPINQDVAQIEYFNELFLLQCNYQKSNKFNMTLQQYFDQFKNQLPKIIQYCVIRQSKQNIEFYYRLQRNVEMKIHRKIQNTRLILNESLIQFKYQQSIDDLIFKRLTNLLDVLLKNTLNECNQIIIKEIHKYLNQYYLNKDVKYQFDNIIVNNNCEDELKWYQLFFSFASKEIQQQWKQSCQNYFINLLMDFPKSKIQNNQQDAFLSKLLDQVLQVRDHQSSNEIIWKLINDAINSNNQFIFLSENLRLYNLIYSQPIGNKLQDKRTIWFSNFVSSHICYECSYYTIPKKSVEKYFLKDFKDDFLTFFQKNKASENKKALFIQFFKILNIFNINYDQNKLNEFLIYITEESFWKKISFYHQKQEKLDQLIETFKFSSQIIDANDLFNQFDQNYYPLLKDLQFYEQTFKNEDQFNSISKDYSQYNQLLITKRCYAEKQQQYYRKFKILQNQSLGSLPFSQESIQDQIQQTMKDNQYWKIIYDEIFKFTDQKNMEYHNFKQKNLLMIDYYSIEQIFSNIEQFIKQQNRQFAKFGVILSSDGEKYMYYASITKIWTYYCNLKWQTLQNNYQQLKIHHTELQDNSHQRQNLKELSILNAREMMKNIQECFLNQFYSKNLVNMIKDLEQSCISNDEIVSQIIQNLKEKKQTQENEAYVNDQKIFIEELVNKKIIEMLNNLEKEYQKKLQNSLQQFFNQIKMNVNILYNIIKEQDFEMQSENYFDLTNKKRIHFDCESYLFYLIAKCLQGDKFKKDELVKVKSNYLKIFSQSYQCIEIPLFAKYYQKLYKKIPYLNIFIQEFGKKLNESIKNYKVESLQLNRDEITQKINQLRQNMIGCQFCCPICNVKCDQRISDKNHKHQSNRGHLMVPKSVSKYILKKKSGFGQINILQTCESIKDDEYVAIFGTKIEKSMKEMKQLFIDWKFNVLSQEQSENQIKDIKFLYDDQIDKQATSKFGFQINQQYNKDFSKKKIHFILFINDQITKMDVPKLRNSCFSCFNQLQQNENTRISILTYNKNPQTIIDCQRIQAENNQQLNLQNNSISLDIAFKMIYQKIQDHKHQNFEKNIILFFTSQTNPYPDQQLQQFTNLSLQQRQSIYFNVYTSIKPNTLGQLEQIIMRLNQNLIETHIVSNVQLENLFNYWADSLKKLRIKLY